MNPSGEFFRGCQLYFLWGKELKSPKISSFFWLYLISKKKYLDDFLALNEKILCFYIDENEFKFE